MKMNENINKMYYDLPTYLKHKPICSVDCQDLLIDLDSIETRINIDREDTKFYSIGKASWYNDGDDVQNEIEKYSLKVFRRTITEIDIWSRQAEELPIWRVLNLALFYISAIYGEMSVFKNQKDNIRNHQLKIEDAQLFQKVLKVHRDDIFLDRILRELKTILDKHL